MERLLAAPETANLSAAFGFPPTTGSVLALLALVGAGPALAQGNAAGSWREEVRRLRPAPIVLPSRATAGPMPMAAAATAASTVSETEPNDVVQTADGVALGDRAAGVVNPAGDVDTWFVDLVAGQLLDVDVDAALLGSPLDPAIGLIAPDGTTLLTANDDFDGRDSRMRGSLTGYALTVAP